MTLITTNPERDRDYLEVPRPRGATIYESFQGQLSEAEKNVKTSAEEIHNLDRYDRRAVTRAKRAIKRLEMLKNTAAALGALSHRVAIGYDKTPTLR